MKKYFRIMLAGALALVMLLSLASCGSNIDIDEVEDALKEYAEDNEDEYGFTSDLEELGLDKKTAKKALEAGCAEIAELKEGIASIMVFADLENDGYCAIVEFENKSDAKKIGKGLEDAIEDVAEATLLEYYKLIAKSSGEDFDKADAKEEIAEAVEYLMDEAFSKFTVEVKGNVIFCGNSKVVETALEVIEEAK